MGLLVCTKSVCRPAAAWIALVFSSLLLHSMVSVHGVPSCPRSCSCPGAKEVHCTFRHLTTIPKTFPKATQRLNLGYNSLTEVEGSEFRSLRQLEMLMLHGNDISRVHPGAFYILRSLQILKLSYNKLTSVNAGLFEGLHSLIRLHLDHNLVEFIEPYSFSGLTSLKLLQLEGNLLKEIHPHTFITLSVLGSFWTSGLKHLHLSDNLLEELPSAAIRTAPRLELLTLHGNPWNCDCQLHWLVEWSATHEGVVKCKKERGSAETCPQCSFPQLLNGTKLLELSAEKLLCERPVLSSPLKEWDNPRWAESEADPDLPYTRDLEKPLGQLTIVLSDSHGNRAFVTCDVRRPGDSSAITWALNSQSPTELSVNVSLVTVLECEIDRETLQNLWQLVAYYYETPAILERGQQRFNTSKVTYQYSQAVNENSTYFTELKGYLEGEPSWLLQPRVTLKLNRQQTTTKKLVMDFTTLITKNINSHGRQGDDSDVMSSWALIRRGTTGRVQSALEGSKINLECGVVTSGSEAKVEWMLPDLSTVEEETDKLETSERGKLVILNATLSDSGLYHCMVRSKAGVDLMPLRLTVKERSLGPTAFNGQKMVIETGGSLSLPCEVSSAQPSQTLWYLPKNKVLLPTQQTRRAEVMENGTLVVRKMTHEDAGEYSCLASNLYGVDMLSHMVEVIGKRTEKNRVQTQGEQLVLPLTVDDGEGSGGGYQEIIRPFATQVPEKVGRQYKKPNGSIKRTRLKKPYKSVKELDPNRWAEILAKTKAKPNVPPPTEQSLQEHSPETVQASTVKSLTIRPTEETLFYSTNPSIDQRKKINFQQNVKTESHLRNEKMKGQYKDSEVQQNQQNASAEPPLKHVQQTPEAVEGITTPSNPLFRQPERKQTDEGRRNVAPDGSNRRIPFQRRRKPPMRRLHPHKKPFYQTLDKPQRTVPPKAITTPPTTTTITTTPATTTPTPTTTVTTTPTTTTTTTSVPITEEYNEPLYTEYETDEDNEKYDEEYDYKSSESLDATEDGILKNSPNTRLHSSATLSPLDRERSPHLSQQQLPIPKTLPTPELESPTFWTAKDLVNLDKSQAEVVRVTENTKQNVININIDKSLPTVRENNNINPAGVQENNMRGSEGQKENSKIEFVTQRYNSQDRFYLVSQNRQRVNTSSSPDQTLFAHPQTAKPTKKPENHQLRVMEPLHPWLHQKNQERGQTSTSRIGHVDQDRNAGRYSQVNPSRHSQPPKVPPTSRWSAHHPPQYYPMYPSWPGQRQFPHPRQGLKPTHRPWPYLHPWGHGSFVTNPPEIIADTVKPTPTFSGTHISKLLPTSVYHHQDHHVDSRTQTRDHLFMSKLRNRYRQAQLDRIAQLGRIATPKPRSAYNPPIAPKTESLSKSRTLSLKPPAPTASFIYSTQLLKPAKPSSSSFHVYPSTPPSHLTPALYGGRINSQSPTAAPPFPWLFGVNGMKPRITPISTASVSVLAEDDVFLPCIATGNPEPNIAWTKVSTGATIPANTKHGPRFEVFRNGTFFIKNVQLQDRGQYLCTAHNRLGSDRMVITLTVQTEAPRILPPPSAEVSIYIGKAVALDCLASGKPPAQISWILPDRTFVREVGAIQTNLSPISLLPNGTLRIHSANFSSKGDYKCIASNAAGADTVTYRLHVAALPPSISEGVQDSVIVQPDRSVFIHCSAKGEPMPALKWMLPVGVHVKASQFLGHRIFVFQNGTLFVKNVLPSDGGRYECLATNAMGIAKRTVLLEVREDPTSSFRKHPAPLPIPPSQAAGFPTRKHVVSALYGSAVFLHCPESTGSSRGTLWQLPSKTILEHQYSPERPIKVFRNGTLRILQLTELDGGNYQCIFQRPNGEDMELFQVKVLMTPPRIEHVRTSQSRVTFGENFQVDCVATGLPNPEVSWSLPDGTLINNALQSDDSGLRNRRFVMYENGTLLLRQMGRKDEGDYTCHATNKLGKDERRLSVKVGPNAPQIGLKSQSLVKVKLGESATLSCQATGEPKPKITWISPKTDVIPQLSDKYRVIDDGTLILKKMTLADEGKYACVARNSAGDDIKNMIVEAELQEPFINGVRGKLTAKLLAVSYQTALLDCKAEGKPEPRVWWLTPYGHALTTPYLGGRFQVHRNGSLELRGVRKTDAGRYNCFAKNHLGEASLSVELEVASLAEKPSFANPNIEILPIKQDGGELILVCPARGTPIPEISWLLPNGTVLSPGKRLHRFTHHFENGTLRISQPVPTDKGIYRCLARNVAGQVEKRYSLEAGWKPVIRGTTGGIKITYGHSLKLPCTVDSWPQAVITWTLPNGVVLDKPQTTGRISFLTNGTLHIRQIAPFDKGTYICKASNSFGSSTLSYPVIVMVFPPRITSTMASITRVIRGTPVMLRCAATGIPKPDISWTLPGRTTLVPHIRYTVQGGIRMTDGGSLVIPNPVLTNSGIYKCNAKNALGTDFKSTYLQVI
ncbi:PREDICTED: matrix-remodeling-associated protein 5-like [Cyprinodon variegatus]|uniref:Si:ch211-159i8.4 n=1 Tax=Cyprinodon variegatus TaxID=28743 RepID=A0A3Q2E4H1_CYPVA|nr:PREDICTED: matrix-remodeling-associated protein 5-like [Cyprinodon variegatus]